ncbi:MAG: SWIM zinc finger family protein [candidate division NC10 bacterium]|nr:SWIM zinc finger family protein [candidate division NC10 bacterium]
MRRRRYSEYSPWGYFPRSTPRPVKGGIKAQTSRGQKFGSTWWADRWIGVLESFGWANRLQRGRSYARRGQVMDFELAPGLVTARVQGSRPKPYTVRIAIKPLSNREWGKVTDAMAAQAVFAAKLLAGEMPQNIEEAFSATKLTLFPRSSKDIETQCSCPDWANPCKHIAAVYYILAEEFDRDPFLLFRLRGRTRDEIVATLREKRAVEAPADDRDTRQEGDEEGKPVSPPLSASLDTFWQMGDPVKTFKVAIVPPAIPEALLKRLGTPPFWRGRQDFQALMSRYYRTISEQALETAFQEKAVRGGSQRRTGGRHGKPVSQKGS